MDWKKTKNILIVALLVMNAVLVYYIYFQDTHTVDPSVGLDTVTQLMAERGIDISRVDYRAYGEMPQFSVNKSKYSLVMLSNLENSGYTLSERNEVLSAYKSIDGMTEEEVGALIDEILNLIETNPESMKKMYDEWLFGKHQILYNQVQDGQVFDDGFLSFEILPGEYFLAKYQWLEIENLGEAYPGEIYPIEKAILSLIDLQPDLDKTLDIFGFEVVYHVDEQDKLIVDSLSMSEPRPYWKATTSDGTIFYYNGLR